MKTSTYRAVVIFLTIVPAIHATSFVIADVHGTPGRHVADETYTTRRASAKAEVRSDGNFLSYTQPSGVGACPEQGPSLGGLEALACAETDTANGALGASSIAHGSASYPSPEALARATIEDTFNFVGTPLFDIDVDLDSSLTGDGDWVMDFTIAMATGNSDHPWQFLYVYAASSVPFADGNGNGSYRSSVTRTGTFGWPTTEYFEGVDPSFDDVFELVGFPTSNITLMFSLSTVASCFEDQCSSIADALNTAHIGIRTPYVSQNGYQYPGANDASPIPEPGGFLLVAAGLATLARGNRRH